MTNKELYRMLEDAFPDVVLGYWKGFPFTAYSNAYIKLHLEAIAEKLGLPDEHATDTICLSQRQRYLAIVVVECCNNTKDKLFGDALHQLADCVDNFNEAEREIYPTEHLLYYTLIHTIINTIKRKY